MLVSATALRLQRYTGLSYDCGRTSLPYAAWVDGYIIRWETSQELAWKRLREEVGRDRTKLDKAQGKLVLTR